MSILSKATTAAQLPVDEVYVIYGPPGSGKTTLAGTFPKTKDAPQLYIDVLEGGGGVFPKADRDLIQVVTVENYKDVDDILTDVMNGFTYDDTGAKIPVKYSSIVIDSITQMEFLLKDYLKKANNKDVMNLNLYGQVKDNQEYLFNMLRLVYNRVHVPIVAICHEKEMANEDNPSFNKLIPSLMASSALSLCAKASFVFYCKVETETTVNANNEAEQVLQYVTYIDAHQYLLTKCRKPANVRIPQKVVNLTYDRFKTNVLDKLTK